MEGTVVINNCGTYRKVSKKDLCSTLLKKEVGNWNVELTTLISRLSKTTQIQVYKDGVVRLFLEHEHFEEKKSVFLYNLPVQVLAILCE